MRGSFRVKRVIRSLVSGIFLAMLIGVSTVGAAAWQAGGRGAEQAGLRGLLDQASQSGSVRVIVQLRVGLLAQAANDPNVAQAQRERISRVQQTLIDRLSQQGQLTARRYQNLPLMAMQVTPEQLQELWASPEVESIQRDELSSPSLASSVPLIGADNAWAAGYTGSGWAVAILDTGVDGSHPFLSGKVVAEACFSGGGLTTSTVCPNGQPQDIGPGTGVNCPSGTYGCDHGTHVAGIAAGKGITFSGVARDADVIAVQVFSQFSDTTCSGFGLPSPCALSYSSDQISGLDWVYSLRGTFNIAAVNMSLGSGSYASPCDSDSRKLAIDNLRGVGIATVVAAGNGSQTDGLSAPACVSTAISVGASTDSDTAGGADKVAPYSNVSPYMSLFAPGSTITSSVPGGGFQTWSGTSMAAPHVAGAWALMKSKSSAASVSDVLADLTGQGVPITDTRTGGSVTKPRIQVDQSIAALVAPPTPTMVPTQTIFLPLIIDNH